VWVPKVGWCAAGLDAGQPVSSPTESPGIELPLACAFAHVPTLPGPGDASVFRIDRGVAVVAALSTRELLLRTVLARVIETV